MRCGLVPPMLPVALVGSGPSNSSDISTVSVPPVSGFSAGAAVVDVVALAMPPILAGPCLRPAIVGVVFDFGVVAFLAAVVPVGAAVVVVLASGPAGVAAWGAVVTASDVGVTSCWPLASFD